MKGTKLWDIERGSDVEARGVEGGGSMLIFVWFPTYTLLLSR